MEDVIKYYVDLFNDKITFSNVSEFLHDTRDCRFDGRMFCPLCSNGCFKRLVLNQLGEEKTKTICSIMFDVKYGTNKEIENN